MKKYISISIILYLFVIAETGFTFNDDITHPALTDMSIKESSLKNYLSQYLGVEFSNEYNSMINGRKVIDWIKQGSIDEDAPPCRASNHFHDPLKDWNSSKVNDMPPLYSGICYANGWFPRYSNVTWATGYLSEAPDGQKASFLLRKPNTWDQARTYYLEALTHRLKTARDGAYANSFQAIGQTIHLLQDMAVPAHTRNDFTSHIPFAGLPIPPGKWINNPFEFYVLNNPVIVNLASSSSDTSPPLFANPRVTSFWDINRYTGQNLLPGGDIGLAEISNIGYFSDSTIPNNVITEEHVYPYPAINNNTYQMCSDLPPSGDLTTILGMKRKYISRKSKGACPPVNSERKADHFAALSFLDDIITDGAPNINLSSLMLFLDDNVHNTYAKELLPRAIGYSAGLLNYFFRGQINMTPYEADPSQYVIKNDADEPLHGIFSLYYDDKTGNRKLLNASLISAGVVTVEAHSTSDPVTFDDPADAQAPGTYMLVFKGTMGNEVGAVVGRVVKLKKLEITAPDRCLFAITDGGVLPQQFKTIKAKVRSANFDGAIQSGTLKAIAKYRERNDYQPDLSTDPPAAESRKPDFSFSTSATKTLTESEIEAFNSNTQKEFTFDFSSSPIPAGITDLYLNVVFAGTLDDAPDTITATGTKDVSEPMHINVWNDSDRFYLYGTLYPASAITGSQSLLELVDHNNDGSSDEAIDPYKMEFRITYCPSATGYAVPHVVYNSISPGEYGRMIVITDSNLRSFPVNVEWNALVYIPNLSSDSEDFPLLDFIAITENQEENGEFKSTRAYPHRQVLGHATLLHFQSYPGWMGMLGGSWPDLAVNEPAVKANVINP